MTQSPSLEQGTRPGPLAGVRVLDLTSHVAGPFASRMLADYGAVVVKVERPGGGDTARTMGPFPGGTPHPERSGMFLSLNTNKRGVVIDLATDEGREVALRLADRADILIEGFRPGVAQRLGLGYDALKARRQALVYCSISNFGQSGPYRDYSLNDFTLYAMGGAMHATGLPDREPIKLGARTQLVHGGYVAAAATLMTYYGATRSGSGDWLDIALFETAMGSVDRRLAHLTAHAYTGKLQGREPDWGGGFPTGVYPCTDGYFFLSGGGRFFARIAEMLDQPDLAADPRFASPEAQRDPMRREEFESTIFLPWLLVRTRQEALVAAQEAGVLSGVINTMADVRESPQFAAREFFVDIDHPEAGTLPYPSAPFRMPISPWAIRGPAPLLGQHTDEVLGEMGYDADSISRLRVAGVVQ